MSALLRVYACVFILGCAIGTRPVTNAEFFGLAFICLIAGLILGNSVVSFIRGDRS